MSKALPLILLGAAAFFLMRSDEEEETSPGGTGSDGEARPFFGTHREYTYVLTPINATIGPEGDTFEVDGWGYVVKSPSGDVIAEYSDTTFEGAQSAAKLAIDQELDGTVE